MESCSGSLRVLSRSSSSSSSSSSSAAAAAAGVSAPSAFPTSLTFSPQIPPPSSSFFPSSSAFSPSRPLFRPSSSSLSQPSLMLSVPPTSAFLTNSVVQPGGKISILTSAYASSASLAPVSSVGPSVHCTLPPAYTPASIETVPSASLPQGPPSGTIGGSFSQNSGIVVVGAIGRAEEDVSQLLNRLLDAQMFSRSSCFKRDSSTSVSKESEKQVRELCKSSWQHGLREDGHAFSCEEGLSEKDLNEELNDSSDHTRRQMGQCRGVTDSGNLSSGTSRDIDRDGQKHDEKLKNVQRSVESVKRAEWMKNRLSHYYDEEKGVMYVQFIYGLLPTQCVQEDIPVEGFPSMFEQSEANSLRGLLYMFSVCHVILLVQDGARVDTRLLRTLRILQNSKHILAPFVKTQVLPGLLPSPSAVGRGSSSRTILCSTSNSPGRGGVVRNTSTIALMSGSAPSLFPGQCTPVLLFVFIEDLSDASPSSSHLSSHKDDGFDVSGPASSQVSSSYQTIGAVHTSRQAPHPKVSNPVVMLARSINKAEGGVRKKLQSSLEAQIRFLIKKCRILSGSGDAGHGLSSGIAPRGPGGNFGSISGTAGGGSLFVLDTARVVFLVDRRANRKCEALGAAIGVIEDMLRCKGVSSNSLVDLKNNPSEDIQAVREFLWRQAEILRGRGGVLLNSAGGSVGVGMVAAAAAAAAASAAAGASGGSGSVVKPLGNPPELPSLHSWLSACQILAEALTMGGVQAIEESDRRTNVKTSQGTRNALQKGTLEGPQLSSQGRDVLGMTLGCLECGMDLDMKFSVAWCKRMLPSAHDVYLKGLPPCYPTSVHKVHLEKALRAFRMMARGPAVCSYAEKLKEECMMVWKSGRQLCDAISLTGRSCIYQVHEVGSNCTSSVINEVSQGKQSEGKGYEEVGSSVKRNIRYLKQHSSGCVFLHACACGRSRRLRQDPFSYESANISFFQFPNCENLLPTLAIPECDGNKPLGASAWSFVLLGNARYYQPTVGLFQSGFCANRKFLSLWTITIASDLLQQDQFPSIEIPQEVYPAKTFDPSSGRDALQQDKLKVLSTVEHHTTSEAKSTVFQKPLKTVERVEVDDLKSAGIKGANLASQNIKPTADMASWGSYEIDLAFPPLQQGHHSVAASGKNMRQTGGREKQLGKSTQAEQQGAWKSEQVVSTVKKDINNFEPHAVSSHKGATVPGAAVVNEQAFPSSANEKLQAGMRPECISIYIGFEHECPHGHRFLLSSEELELLGSVFAVQNEKSLSRTPHRVEKMGISVRQLKDDCKSFQSVVNPAISENNLVMSIADLESFARQPSESPFSIVRLSQLQTNIPKKLCCKVAGEGYELLNRNLPIYMNCPYCKKTPELSENNDFTFAGTISQLQRIFVATPSFPILLAACPVVQFDKSYMPDTVNQNKSSIEFSLGCNVVLPPDSFLSLRLPFVYFMELDSGSRQPLLCKVNQPELSAWLLKNSALKVLSVDERSPYGGIHKAH